MVDRKKIMQRTSWISVIGNTLLSLLKIVVGIVAGSMAVLSDGLDSASDVVISAIILFTSSIVSRPPNSKYVYGQEKAEHIASTILSFIIFFMGCQIIITSAEHIIYRQSRELPSMPAIWATAASIAGKLLLSWYQFHQGKRVDSSMLKANAINMRNDVIISGGVLVGLACTFLLDAPVLDPVIAGLIGIYILGSAIGIFRDANVVLMDGVDDTSVYNKIIDAVEKVPGAYHPHRIRSRQVGNRYSIVLDIEADGLLTLTEAHQIAQDVENSITDSIENIYDIVVHVEPKGSSHCAEKYGISRDELAGGQ
ncbi:MAG: cation diffusion facilitator family transporter [Tannerella sp.]|jgi:cation diffusion facilitator family transporter|nr:cation diffusion facilitator family transporter [Tannerella sp.]